MPHDTPLISMIVAGLVLAFILGTVAHRLRMPPLVGYLVAGIVVGPYTPGFVANQSLALELAEIGVILLMFGVGLHFSLKDLLSVRAIAIPGAIVQIGVATLLGWGLGTAMGWPVGGSLVFGLSLSVASTVVLLKAMQDRRLIETERGKIAVGWLIVEDLAMVLALVLIPAVANVSGGQADNDPVVSTISRLVGFKLEIGGILAVTLLKVVAFVGVMLIVGRRVIPWVLHFIAHSGSRELFRLCVLATALGVAFGAAKLFGVSLALGAFFAGMILSESELSNRAAQESLPLRDAFAVLFFVSVGMLFDPSILMREPLTVAATVFIIVVGKSVAAFLIVRAFRKSVSTALTISASLAQIGEFSFILAELGVGLKLLPEESRDLILAGAILSIILNPLVFSLCERLRPRLEARLIRPAPGPATPAESTAVAATAATPAEPAAAAAVQPEPSASQVAPGSVPLAEPQEDEGIAEPTLLFGHDIIIGYGRVGAIVVDHLKAGDVPFLVMEDADSRVEALRRRGIEVVVGNAASPEVLRLAGLEKARALLVAIPNAFEAGQIVEQAREANPGLLIVARAHSDAEVTHLLGFGADTVIMGEREIARGMIERLDASEPPAAPVDEDGARALDEGEGQGAAAALPADEAEAGGLPEGASSGDASAGGDEPANDKPGFTGPGAGRPAA